ncbi:uncharacterized protein LOC125179586 [Hyalella azteca]|uniref:Uncharacterized protein LOC125179586 n=1 Tax=Hyalella azteca TaxID=294128 RepID=A0A979FYJ9_HYAAZ|nr:uncharacterized protein LOC125179586 [Hyalella azteca]
MQRTPPNCKSDAMSTHPSGKLAAVTRKQNLIEEELLKDTVDCVLIRAKYTDYLLQLETFLKACEQDVDEDWLRPHRAKIDLFRSKMEDFFASQREPDACSSHGSRRSGSVRSAASSTTSSARVKLAQQRAKTYAEKALFEKEERLKEKEMAIRRSQLQQEEERKRIQLQQEEERKRIQLQQEEERKRIQLQQEEELEKINLQKRRIEIEKADIENKVLEEQLDSLEERRDSMDISSSSESIILRKTSKRLCTNRGLENCPSAAISGALTQDVFINVLEKQNEISSLLARNQEEASLPPKKLEPFSGEDVTEFKAFLNKFESVIESKCTNNLDRLAYLEQYTIKDAQKLVKSCLNADATIAYQQAKLLLKREYGDEFRVADAYLTTLHAWPEIKSEDAHAFTELSLYLMRCQNYLKDASQANPLQNPKVIMEVILKLPYKLREQWRQKTRTLMRSSRPVVFEHLVEFIQDHVDLLKQPLFGHISDKVVENKLKPATQRSKRILASVSSDVKNEKSCVCCKKDNHTLSECFFFEKMSFPDKTSFVRKNGLCFKCLEEGHLSKVCLSKPICKTCQGPHQTAMHKQVDPTSQQGKREQISELNTSRISVQGSAKSARADTVAGVGDVIKGSIICPVVPAKVKTRTNSKEITVYVALDTHSTDCWINEKLLHELGDDGEESSICVTTISSVSQRTKTKILRNLLLSDIDGNKVALLPLLYSRDEQSWPFSKDDIPSSQDVLNYDYLRDVPFNFVDAEVNILIGMNNPGLLKCLKIVDGGWNQPFASLHWLGWALNGPVRRAQATSACKRTNIINSVENDLEIMYSRDFAEPEDGVSMSMEDLAWERKVSSSINTLPNGQCEISLPFIADNPIFPCNREQILKRFKASLSKFRRNPNFYAEYQDFMDLMVKNDFAEKVPVYELETQPGKCWYLPHHAVYHKQKGKLRVVFDCSNKYREVSLNDMLLQGPDLANNLIGVLLRFRQESFAFAADIEKMFYCVRVPRCQSDFLRFFWIDDVEGAPVEFRLRVHVFGARSSPSIANYALQRAAATHSSSSLVQRSIHRNFYVDDLLKSTSDLNEAVNLMQDIKSTLAQGGFNLTGIRSNSRPFLDAFPKTELAQTLKQLDFTKEDLPKEKTLGVLWNADADFFTFAPLQPPGCSSRRNILSLTASIYDPLGLIAPVIVRGRKIFQESCRLHLDWDQPLPPELRQAWEDWLASLDSLSAYEIPRCLKFSVAPRETISTELHTFCDGSETAYGAVCYLRFITFEGAFVSPPVFSKARLTPLGNKTLKTIPRIELCAAKLAVDVARCVQREIEFNLDKRYFWSDSTTVLSYIRNDSRRFQRFVANKVAYVRTWSDAGDWRHVPSEHNPADLLKLEDGSDAQDWTTKKSTLSCYLPAPTSLLFS